MKGANLDFDDNCRTNLKAASEVNLFLLFRWKTLKIMIAYHVFQFGNLLNIVCGDDGNN